MTIFELRKQHGSTKREVAQLSGKGALRLSGSKEAFAVTDDGTPPPQTGKKLAREQQAQPSPRASGEAAAYFSGTSVPTQKQVQCESVRSIADLGRSAPITSSSS